MIVSMKSPSYYFPNGLMKTNKADRMIIAGSNRNKKDRRNKTPTFDLVVVALSLLFIVVVTYHKKKIAVHRDLSVVQDGLNGSTSRIVGVEVVSDQLEGDRKEEEKEFSSDDELLFTTKGQWSDVKLAIYMTTHFSETHISFLPCWYDAIRRMKIFQYADLILYTPSVPPATILQQLPFDTVKIKLYNNTGYQSGAVQAMVDPFLDPTDLWFDEYDWVIRLNPDVLIRNDTWLIQTMLNTSVDAIVHDCKNRKIFPTRPPHTVQQQRPKFHTDFTAFRPVTIDRNLLLVQNRSNAELHYTNSIRNIYYSRRFAYVEGGHNSVPGRCRIEGVHSPILHVHELQQFCPYYYNATRKGIY